MSKDEPKKEEAKPAAAAPAAGTATGWHKSPAAPAEQSAADKGPEPIVKPAEVPPKAKDDGKSSGQAVKEAIESKDIPPMDPKIKK